MNIQKGLKEDVVLVSEVIENHSREIEAMFLKWKIQSQKIDIQNEKFIGWGQEQLMNAEEMDNKCKDKSIGII